MTKTNKTYSITFHSVIRKAVEIRNLSIYTWKECVEMAMTANKINKSALVREMILEAGRKGILKESLQIFTGWDLHNLHSVLRESFCERYGISYQNGRFFQNDSLAII